MKWQTAIRRCCSILCRALDQFEPVYVHIMEPRRKGNVLVLEQGAVASGQLRKMFEAEIVAECGFEPATAGGSGGEGRSGSGGVWQAFPCKSVPAEKDSNGLPLNEYDRKSLPAFDAYGYNDESI